MYFRTSLPLLLLKSELPWAELAFSHMWNYGEDVSGIHPVLSVLYEQTYQLFLLLTICKSSCCIFGFDRNTGEKLAVQLRFRKFLIVQITTNFVWE
jgi:hypothetical protein